MFRNHSYAQLSATVVFGLTVLNGCTIYTNSGPPPSRYAYTRRPAVPPPPPAAPPPQKGVIIASRTPAHPTVVTPPTQTGTPGNAPAITSPNVFGNGNGGAFRGLAYVIPETSRGLPNVDQLVPFATLYTDSFDIPPQAFSAGFPGALKQSGWFAIRYDGSFSIPTDGSCTFQILSTDGAILYIDGQKVADNDGVHSATLASGKKDLRAGLHQLRLDYFKAAQGAVALRVFVTVGNGTQNLLVGVAPR
jgi:hypothetical protein